jgi:hypothetical protein
MTRLEEFPLPAEVMPARLKALLGEVTTEQQHMKIEVAASFEHDKYGLGGEALHMTMLVLPAGMADQLRVLEEPSTGRISIGPPRGPDHMSGAGSRSRARDHVLRAKTLRKKERAQSTRHDRPRQFKFFSGCAGRSSI